MERASPLQFDLTETKQGTQSKLTGTGSSTNRAHKVPMLIRQVVFARITVYVFDRVDAAKRGSGVRSCFFTNAIFPAGPS